MLRRLKKTNWRIRNIQTHQISDNKLRRPLSYLEDFRVSDYPCLQVLAISFRLELEISEVCNNYDSWEQGGRGRGGEVKYII